MKLFKNKTNNFANLSDKYIIVSFLVKNGLIYDCAAIEYKKNEESLKKDGATIFSLEDGMRLVIKSNRALYEPFDIDKNDSKKLHRLFETLGGIKVDLYL